MTAIACYYIFNEKITKFHIIGMALLLLSAVLLGLSSFVSSTSYEITMTIMVPLSLVVLVATMACFGAIISKYTVLNGSISTL
jgi:drug/metabolite transporter (DMT)-like permease